MQNVSQVSTLHDGFLRAVAAMAGPTRKQLLTVYSSKLIATAEESGLVEFVAGRARLTLKGLAALRRPGGNV